MAGGRLGSQTEIDHVLRGFRSGGVGATLICDSSVSDEIVSDMRRPYSLDAYGPAAP